MHTRAGGGAPVDASRRACDHPGMRPQLITIRFSHYCEKARWALDRAAVAYDEVPYGPVFSSLVALRHGRSRTVPQLRLPGVTLTESTDILRYADAHGSAPPLFPTVGALADDVVAVEDELDRKLGPAARRVAYGHLIRDPGLPRMVLAAGPAWQQRLPTVVGRGVVGLIRRGLKIDAAGVARSRAALDALFDALDARLADGRPYLCGDQFTAADLTLAALAAPLVLPPGYLRWTTNIDADAPALVAAAAELRARPTGALAYRLYQDHRAG